MPTWALKLNLMYVVTSYMYTKKTVRQAYRTCEHAYVAAFATCMLTALVTLVAIILTVRYMNIKSNYIYKHADECYIENTFMLSETRLEAHCDSCGGRCEKCYWTPREYYYGIWNVTTIDCVAQIRTATYDSVAYVDAELQSVKSVKSIHKCYRGHDCLFRWARDTPPDNAHAQCVLGWTLSGALLVCSVIMIIAAQVAHSRYKHKLRAYNTIAVPTYV